MDDVQLRAYFEALSAQNNPSKPPDFEEYFSAFLSSLETGNIRAAEPVGESWKVNEWVKAGILFGFKYGKNERLEHFTPWPFSDKTTYPLQQPDVANKNIRLVPGGSAVRRGAFLGKDVTMMPPMYVNVGAYVGNGTMVDSHALIGSCAQIGQRVHVSAAAQIGGVLEPIGAMPVIVEDDCLIGGNSGIYEGTRIGRKAVVGAGVVLTRSTPVYDLVREQILRGSADRPLVIPPGAVVVPGSRPITTNSWAHQQGVHLYTAVIVKYRDAKTDVSTTLEELLR